jgi:hypothetical protein
MGDQNASQCEPAGTDGWLVDICHVPGHSHPLGVSTATKLVAKGHHPVGMEEFEHPRFSDRHQYNSGIEHSEALKKINLSSF